MGISALSSLSRIFNSCAVMIGIFVEARYIVGMVMSIPLRTRAAHGAKFPLLHAEYVTLT